MPKSESITSVSKAAKYVVCCVMVNITILVWLSITSVWKWYTNCMAVHPVRTQVISSSILWGVGDIIAQSITHANSKKQLHSLQITHHEADEFEINWKRVAITGMFGLVFIGPFGHFWYENLDRFITGQLHLQPKSIGFITTKVAMDGLFFGPFDLFVFFAYMGFLNGKNIAQVKEELKRDYFLALLLEGGVWPFVQVANFRYVPVNYQLLYVNIFCLFDSAFLSWLEQQNDAPWKKHLLASLSSFRKQIGLRR